MSKHSEKTTLDLIMALNDLADTIGKKLAEADEIRLEQARQGEDLTKEQKAHLKEISGPNEFTRKIQ